MSDNTLNALAELGYKIDTSVTPYVTGRPREARTIGAIRIRRLGEGESWRYP